jgi:hypothetical protein
VKRTRSIAKLDEVLFGTRFNAIVVDESHGAKGTGSAANQALSVLTRQTPCVLGLTATPIVTDALDVAAIARMLNIPGFTTDADNANFKDMRREIQRKKKAEGGARAEQSRLLHRLQTKDGTSTPTASEALAAMVSAAGTLRIRLRNSYIRRTPRTKTSGLTPEEELKYPPRHRDIVIELNPSLTELTELEKQYLELELSKVFRKGEAVSFLSLFSLLLECAASRGRVGCAGRIGAHALCKRDSRARHESLPTRARGQ